MCSLLRNAIAAVFIMSFLAAPALAGEEAGLSVDATYAGRYVWRGFPVNEEAVLQPSATLSGGGFSLNVWSNMELTDWGERAGYGDEQGNATEVDYTGSYTAKVGPVGMELGFVTYTFPNLYELGDSLSTTEVYLGLGLEAPLYFSLTTYLDVDGRGSEGASYTSLDLGHSFELLERLCLDLSAGLGYADHDFIEAYYGLEEDGGLHEWSASACLTFAWEGFYLSPGYAYASLIHDEARDEVEDVWELDPESGYVFVGVGWDSKLMNRGERI